MARVELKALGLSPFVDRNGNVRAGIAFTSIATVYAASTGGTTLTGGQLITNVDGEPPGWLDSGLHTITVPSTSKTYTFEVGGAASGSAASAVTFTPTGGITEGNVQAAVAGVDARLTSVESSGLLSGAGAPGAGLGANGQLYIDTAANLLYGPKTAGAWGTGTALVGPVGPAGTVAAFSGDAEALDTGRGLVLHKTATVTKRVRLDSAGDLLLEGVTATLLVTSGLVLDLDAATITGLAEAAEVTTWAGSSGTARDATQATAGSKPTYRATALNGAPCVRFDGTNDWMDLGTAAMISAVTGAKFTVMWAAKHANAGIAYLFARDSNVGTREFALGSDSATFGPRSETAGTGGLSGAAHSNAAHVFCIEWDSGTARARIDSTLVQTLTGQATAGSLASTSFTVGRRNYAGAEGYMNADLGRIVAYDRILSVQELLSAEGTLRNQFGTP
jgi:hypothetical protein